MLEENTFKSIEASKKCLQLLSVSSTSSNSDNACKKSDADGDISRMKDDVNLELLHVAVYSLRAVIFTLKSGGCSDNNASHIGGSFISSSQTTYQVAINLLYHYVVISSDACHSEFQSFSSFFLSLASSSSLSSRRKKEDLKLLDYASICHASYEGLG